MLTIYRVHESSERERESVYRGGVKKFNRKYICVVRGRTPESQCPMVSWWGRIEIKELSEKDRIVW